MLNINQFKQVVSFVIDNLEGGYYHPDMLKDGRIKDSRYSASGETMFGIDRLRGGSINTTPAGLKFWQIIDNANARKTWKWNYKGGSYAEELKDLVAQMMFPQYLKLSKRYLSEEAQKIVASDNRLLFNFIYATWNGSGWFQRFSRALNKKIEEGVKNKDKLVNFVVKLRTENSNSLIRQGGSKIERLMDEVPELKKKF